MSGRAALLVLACLLGAGCAPGLEPSPFERVEDQVWRQVTRNHLGRDGLYVQATWNTFAYELTRLYARAEAEGLGQEQLESRIRQFLHGYIDARYPVEDGTDINNLYVQYLVYVNPSFDPGNPLQRKVFDNWRSEYVRRVLGTIYDSKYPILRERYDERWGRTLYSRLVFTIYLENREGAPPPSIADIGERTFLVDAQGNRYEPSGLAGPYPSEADRPEGEVLSEKVHYRLYFPNRRKDRKSALVAADAPYLQLEVHGLGSEPVRAVRWELPLAYPEMPERRLPTEEEVAAARRAEEAE